MILLVFHVSTLDVWLVNISEVPAETKVDRRLRPTTDGAVTAAVVVVVVDLVKAHLATTAGRGRRREAHADGGLDLGAPRAVAVRSIICFSSSSSSCLCSAKNHHTR